MFDATMEFIVRLDAILNLTWMKTIDLICLTMVNTVTPVFTDKV